jgi:hypothetical protein
VTRMVGEVYEAVEDGLTDDLSDAIGNDNLRAVKNIKRQLVRPAHLHAHLHGSAWQCRACVCCHCCWYAGCRRLHLQYLRQRWKTIGLHRRRCVQTSCAMWLQPMFAAAPCPMSDLCQTGGFVSDGLV